MIPFPQVACLRRCPGLRTLRVQDDVHMLQYYYRWPGDGAILGSSDQREGLGITMLLLDWPRIR